MTRPTSPTHRAQERRSGLRSRSKKRQRFMATTRAPLVAEMLTESPWCELGPLIATVDPAWPCTRRAEGLHELRKRTAGGSLTNRANLRRACNRCNGWLEDHPDLGRTLGLVVRAGDPTFEELGAAHDEEATRA